MDARLIRAAVVLSVAVSGGATVPSANFVVTAPTEEIARQVAQTAEIYRRELAIEWLGREMPRWAKPCEVHVKVGQLGAGGATTFAFHDGEVFGWRMTIQGTLERILDSVVPHEVSHTVFASHFRRPLPRWADEGAATLVEHESERKRQELLLQQVWKTTRRIPLKNLLAITEYPSDMQDVLTLYAEGYSLADFLVQRGGRARFLAFLDDANERGWEKAIQHHYGYKGVPALEQSWNDWMMAGSPRLNLPAGQQLAASERPEATVRAQSPEEGAEGAGADGQVAAQEERFVPPSSEEARGEVRSATQSLAELARHEGRQRALSDGWVPAAPETRPAAQSEQRSETVARPADVPRASGGGSTRGPARELPRDDGRSDGTRQRGQVTAAVPAWSEFPRARQ